MSRFVRITEKEFDDYLKPEKGWKKNICGYEYVYDFIVPSIPSVMIKVMSSINTGTGEGRNRGSDCIRVFAVRVDNQGKVIGGYIRKKKVYRTTNWKQNLLDAYKVVLSQVRERAKKDGLV